MGLEGRTWSRMKVWGKAPPPLEKRSLSFLIRLRLLGGAVGGSSIARADVGRTSSFQLHSQAKWAKIPRREKHNKFRLQVRVPAGYKLEDEQLGVDVGGARERTSLETIWKTEQTCSSLCSKFFFFYIFHKILPKVCFTEMFWLTAGTHIKDRRSSNLC